MLKLLFLASDNFPVPILSTLIRSKKIKVAGLVTSANIVEENLTSLAKDNNISIFKPENFQEESKTILEKTKPDIVLVCNFGQILNDYILKYPKHDCLNIHASLLPKLRGACPIEMAILQNHAETGLTIQLMKKKLDTGDILFQKEVEISKKETGGSLRKKLQKMTVENIERILVNWIEEKIKPRQQDDSKATYCYRDDISKKVARINWHNSAEEIERKIRAFNPKPVAWTMLKTSKGNKRLRIFKAKTSKGSLDLKPGNSKIQRGQLLISTGKGTLIPEIIQLEGKKKMLINEFLKGFREKITIT